MKQYKLASMLIGLSSLLSVAAIAPASFANHLAEVAANAEGQDTETLRQGLPGRRLGGGTRSGRVFLNANASLAALTTANPLSVTTAERPTLLFYVPEMLAANEVEFVLYDRNDELAYETTFTLAREGGLVSLGAEQAGDIPVLDLNETYAWYFSIISDASDRAQDIVVHGSIRRVNQADWLANQSVDAKLSQRLATATPLAKAQILYQQADLWHDAALILSDLHQANPENALIAAEWNALLASVGLDSVLQPLQPALQVGLN
ncbi:MAG: DUF928 domain-containing protein [Phormidesmis sp.]